MNNFSPALSIIIPAHNESAAITKTIVSVLKNQITYPHEIIIACNGCADDTARIARKYEGIQVIESAKSGMSFGKNFGARSAKNDFFIFIDADTTLPVGSIDRMIKYVAKKARNPQRVIGTMAGYPEKGGIVVKTCFLIANFTTRRHKVHAPGGVMLMNREVFESIDGFDESLPQGTSTDFIMRAIASGAEYIFIGNPKATTSIRRFEKQGIISQMLDWRKNHKHMRRGRHDEIEEKDYKVIR